MSLRSRFKSFFVGDDPSIKQAATMTPEQQAAMKELLEGLPGYMEGMMGDVENPYAQLGEWEPGYQEQVEKGMYRDLAAGQRQMTQAMGPHKYAAAMGSANMRAGMAGDIARLRSDQYRMERGMEFGGAMGAMGAETQRRGAMSGLYAQAFQPSFENVYTPGERGLFAGMLQPEWLGQIFGGGGGTQSQSTGGSADAGGSSASGFAKFLSMF